VRAPFTASRLDSVLRGVVGVTLATSGLAKLCAPWIAAKAACDRLPLATSGGCLKLVLGVATLEVLVSIGLQVRPVARYACWTALGLFATFLAASARDAMSGAPWDCGCFGALQNLNALPSRVAISVMCLLALSVVLQRATQRSHTGGGETCGTP
jgi:hypothetical protein